MIAVLFSGFAVSLVFCFVVFPQIQDSYQAVLDPDNYGHIGINLWKGYGFSLKADEGPTVYRGPLYPAFITLILYLTSGWYPGGVWFAQSLLFGFSCLFVYLIAKKCWNQRIGLAAGFGCVFYPVLFWYIPRMWNEGLLMFLVTGLIYISIFFIEKSSILKSIVIGFLLGLLCLCKGVFLPFIIALPLCFISVPKKIKPTLIFPIVLVAVLLIAPWTIRNYLLVGKVVPVHTGAGFNLKLGNSFASDFFNNPWSYKKIFWGNIIQIKSLTQGILSSDPQKNIEEEKILMENAWADIKSDPSLILKKILVAGSMFWYIGDNRQKTIFLIILRLPILILAILGIFRTIRLKEIRLWPAIVIILTYWISHWPFAPPSRLSIPIMPLVFIFAVVSFFSLKNRKKFH